MENRMMDRFRRTGVAAGKPKVWKQFRMPMASAASEMKKRYGKMIRFRVTASSQETLFPALDVNVWTTIGEKTIPSMVMTAATSAMVQNNRLANSHISSFDFSLMEVVKTGIKEAVMDPSATSRRNMLGIR